MNASHFLNFPANKTHTRQYLANVWSILFLRHTHPWIKLCNDYIQFSQYAGQLRARVHGLNHKTAIELLQHESFLKMSVPRQEKILEIYFIYACRVHSIIMAFRINFVRLGTSLFYWDNIQQ